MLTESGLKPASGDGSPDQPTSTQGVVINMPNSNISGHQIHFGCGDIKIFKSKISSDILQQFLNRLFR